MRIGMRQEELLSYLQGITPVGEWFVPVINYISKDLNMPHSQVCWYLAILSERGILERRNLIKPAKYFEYRVLHRLESGKITIDTSRYRLTPEQREAARRSKMPKPEKKKERKLIAYAGAE